MLDADKIKLNNILVSINQSNLTVGEVALVDYVYTTEKQYYDSILSVLNYRKATNTTYRLFYDNAKANSVGYDNEIKASLDIFIIGGSN